MRFEKALKNYLKTSEWKYQKAIDEGFDTLKHPIKDPVAAREAFNQLSGIGTGNLGLAGIIRNPAMSKQLANPATAVSKVLDQLRKYNKPTLVQEGTGGPYLSDGALNFLAKNIGKYYQHIGTEKDPMYKLIEKGVVNADNLDLLSNTPVNSKYLLNRIKGFWSDRPDAKFQTAHFRNSQNIDTPYHNTSGEKKAIEELYDQILTKDNIIKYDKNGILSVFDFARKSNKPMNSGFIQNIGNMPYLVREAIDNNFLKESNMSNSRIGLPEFMTGIARLWSQKNNIGLNEWESTQPILNVGDYTWHKLPYNIKAQKVEGNKMNNCAGDICVASPGEKDIYSLRRADTNTPKVNFVHLPGNESNQIKEIRGISNSDPKEKYFEAIEQLKQYLGIK